MSVKRLLQVTALLGLFVTNTVLAKAGPSWTKAQWHPAVKHLVAITWFDEPDDKHGGNGVIVGPGGCYVMTNAHVAMDKGNRADPREFLPMYVSHTEAFADRENRPLRISADLDLATGKFRRTLKARLWNVEPLYFRKDLSSRGVLYRLLADLAIYRLDECMGEEFSIALIDLPPEQPQPLGDLYNIHVWKTGAQTGELYVQGPCQVDQQNKNRLVFQSNCPSRDGMSGSVYITTDRNGMIHATGQISRGDEKISQGILARAMERLLSPQLLNRYAETHIPADKRPPMHNLTRLPIPPSGEERDRLENAAWALCSAASTREPCDVYLYEWQGGRFAAQARAKIVEVEDSRRRQEAAATASGVLPGCSQCPEVVVLARGQFTMGGQGGEVGRPDVQGTQRIVSIAYRLMVGKTEVTRREFAAFVSATGYRTDAEREPERGCHAWNGGTSKWELAAGRSWRDPGFEQEADHPVVCVSWNDAQAYIWWLNEVGTVKGWRLLNDAEWEYAARAGTSTRFWWGDDARNDQQCRYANGADQTAAEKVPSASRWTIAACDDGFAYTAPVKRFLPNPWGLHDMQGNVWEWAQDCFSSPGAAPSDGSASTAADCARRVLRGGSWSNHPQVFRSTVRGNNSPSARMSNTGFRLGRTLF